MARSSPTRSPTPLGALALVSALVAPACDGTEPSPDSPGARETATDATPPRPGDAGEPRLVARRELPLPGRPSGVAWVPRDGERPAVIATTIEQTGALVLWAVDGLDEEPRTRTLAAGAFPVGPLDLGGRRLAVASMTERTLRVFDVDTGTVDLDVALPATPRRLATGTLTGRGALVAVTVGPRELMLVEGEALHGPFTLPTERSTALAFAADGSGLWVGSQSPPAVFFVAAGALGTPGAVEASRLHPLPGIPRVLVFVDFDGAGERALHVLGGDHDLFEVPDPASDDALVRRDFPAGLPMDAVAADLDGDGRDELIALSSAHSSYVVLGRPDGAGFGHSFSEYSGQSSLALAIGDVDADGRADLLVVNRDSLALAVLHGRSPDEPGAGPFFGAARVPVGRTPLDLVLLDLDGDGALEAAVVSGAEGKLVLVERGPRGLQRGREIELGPSPSQIVAGDLDGDGREDLVVLTRPSSGAAVTVLFGTPAGDFARRAVVQVDPGTSGLTLARLGTGAALAWADPGTGRLNVQAYGEERRRALALTPRPAGVTALSLREGGDELAVWLAGERSYLARVVVRDDELAEAERIELAGFPVHAATGDLDGDGTLDVAVLTRTSPDASAGQVEVFLSRGGRWVAGPRVRTGLSPQRVAVGDINRDGRADVVVAAQNRHVVHLWCGQPKGDGIELVRRPEIGMGLGPMSVALGDMTGNGWLDIAAVNAFSDDLTVVYALAPE